APPQLRSRYGATAEAFPRRSARPAPPSTSGSSRRAQTAPPSAPNSNPGTTHRGERPSRTPRQVRLASELVKKPNGERHLHRHLVFSGGEPDHCPLGAECS